MKKLIKTFGTNVYYSFKIVRGIVVFAFLGAVVLIGSTACRKDINNSPGSLPIIDNSPVSEVGLDKAKQTIEIDLGLLKACPELPLIPAETEINLYDLVAQKKIETSLYIECQTGKRELIKIVNKLSGKNEDGTLK